MTNAHDDTDRRVDEESPGRTTNTNTETGSGAGAESGQEREGEGESGRDESPQYASLDLEDGDTVIYDPDNHRAWIQSDEAVEAPTTL